MLLSFPFEWRLLDRENILLLLAPPLTSTCSSLAGSPASSSSSSSAIWMRLASSMDGPSRWVSMVLSFPTFLLDTANRGLRLGVVVLERRRTCPAHLLCRAVLARLPPLPDAGSPGSWTLGRRRWLSVEEGSPALDLRRALLVGTATLGRRCWGELESTPAGRAVSFLLK